MRQWIGSALVQIMACRLLGARPNSKPVLGYCQSDPYEQTSVKSEWKHKTFNHERAFGNVVCEMAAIFSRSRWVNCNTYWVPARWAFGFSGDPQQNIQYVLIYRCYVLTHVWCSLFSIGNKVITTYGMCINAISYKAFLRENVTPYQRM